MRRLRSKRTRGTSLRSPVAEIHLALREACRNREQASHLMGHAVGIGKALAERHIATALAVHRFALRKTPQAVHEILRCGQTPRVQFRIAARQPTQVAVKCRRFVVERREWNEFGACAMPFAREM